MAAVGGPIVVAERLNLSNRIINMGNRHFKEQGGG